jgi:nucleoside-diphosphate-sugar epimerase
LAAAAETDGAVGETINLGYGEDISIGELAERIAKAMKRDVTIVEDAERLRPDQSEVTRLLCDNRKARKLLHWTPKHSLDDGLALTIAWFSEEQNLAGYRTDRYVI